MKIERCLSTPPKLFAMQIESIRFVLTECPSDDVPVVAAACKMTLAWCLPGDLASRSSALVASRRDGTSADVAAVHIVRRDAMATPFCCPVAVSGGSCKGHTAPAHWESDYKTALRTRAHAHRAPNARENNLPLSPFCAMC